MTFQQFKQQQGKTDEAIVSSDSNSHEAADTARIYAGLCNYSLLQGSIPITCSSSDCNLSAALIDFFIRTSMFALTKIRHQKSGPSIAMVLFHRR
jgi:hypothetical protein